MRTRRKNNSVDAKKIQADLKELLHDGELLLKMGGNELAEQGQEFCDKLTDKLEVARESCRQLESYARNELEHMDESVHEKPYPYLVISCAVGLLLGLYLTRR